MIRTLLLASESPRRRELAKRLGFPLETVSPKLDEAAVSRAFLTAGGAVQELPRRLAEAKAEAAYAAAQPAAGTLVLAADTIVLLDGEILHKPEDLEEAREMLRALSGRVHQVITGVALKEKESLLSFAEETSVYFYPLDSEQELEIERYLATGGPLDKAGAYGIQEGGAFLIQRIEGDYFNVVGLPLARLRRQLLTFSAQQSAEPSLQNT